jgi:hypothetical protein
MDIKKQAVLEYLTLCAINEASNYHIFPADVVMFNNDKHKQTNPY